MIAGRTQMIEKAIRIVLLFQNRNDICIRDIANELECDYSQGHRWLQDASRVMPIVETKRQRCKLFYSLLKD